MAPIGDLSTARNSGKLCDNQVFSDGDDAANNHSGEVAARDAKEPFPRHHLPEQLQRKPAGPSVVLSVQRVNTTEWPADRDGFRGSQSSHRSMSHKLDIL
jgi:hypothetical protein